MPARREARLPLGLGHKLQVECSEFQASHEPALNALNFLAPALMRVPTWMLSGLSNQSASLDIQATNVPGHASPIYLAGTEVMKVYGFGPVASAMMVAMISYVGTCYIGVNFDAAAVAKPDVFELCLQEGLDEVVALGHKDHNQLTINGEEIKP